MAELRIGTCSWKYDSWRGLVYSDQPKLNHLAEYARKYKTVEVDQWFWSLHGIDKVSLPKPAVVNDYVRAVPVNFRFSVKVPNSITLTHLYRKSKIDPLLENPHFLSVSLFNDFLNAIDPMKPFLGPLMFQFEYLNKQKMPSQDEFQNRFKEFIRQCSRDYSYGIEIRNPNYLNKSYFHFLQDIDCCQVFLQGYYMPPVVDVFSKFGSLINKMAVIRLHGPDRETIESKSRGNWSQRLDPKEEELQRIVDMTQELLSRDVSVYLNINNHYEGSAPLTIERIEGMLTSRGG